MGHTLNLLRNESQIFCSFARFSSMLGCDMVLDNAEVQTGRSLARFGPNGCLDAVWRHAASSRTLSTDCQGRRPLCARGTIHILVRFPLQGLVNTRLMSHQCMAMTCLHCFESRFERSSLRARQYPRSEEAKAA